MTPCHCGGIPTLERQGPWFIAYCPECYDGGNITDNGPRLCDAIQAWEERIADEREEESEADRYFDRLDNLREQEKEDFLERTADERDGVA